jgi:hypothetical protein
VPSIYRKYTTSVSPEFEGIAPGITSRFEVFTDDTFDDMEVSLSQTTQTLEVLTILRSTIAGFISNSIPSENGDKWRRNRYRSPAAVGSPRLRVATTKARRRALVDLQRVIRIFRDRCACSQHLHIRGHLRKCTDLAFAGQRAGPKLSGLFRVPYAEEVSSTCLLV